MDERIDEPQFSSGREVSECIHDKYRCGNGHCILHAYLVILGHVRFIIKQNKVISTVKTHFAASYMPQ
jgi:hypothetical protein